MTESISTGATSRAGYAGDEHDFLGQGGGVAEAADMGDTSSASSAPDGGR